MAITKLHNYSVQEKLNKMDVDIIDVTLNLDNENTGAYADGDLLFPVTEIPYAVSVNGGSALLQSVSIIITGSADGSETGNMDLVITSDATALIKSGPASLVDNEAIAGTCTSPSSVMDGICGSFSINNMLDMGIVSVGSKQNIGMVCKAEAASRSLHVFGIARSTNDYEEGSAILRLGFVKD